MQSIFFTKLSTLGNNYLFLNFLDQVEFISDYSKLAIEMTNRQNGIFADGIIILTPSNHADLKMTIYNNDGSRAKTCGNGLRLIGQYFMDNNPFNKNNLTIETDSNISKIYWEDGIISADLGYAYRLLDPHSPLLNFDDLLHTTDEIKTSFGVRTVDMISMGNPHFIFYTEGDHEPFFEEMEAISRIFDVNVGIITILNESEFNLTTYERGSGFTGACGTNTAAATASAVLRQKLRPQTSLKANLPGGILYLSWTKEKKIQASQKASIVCCGTYFYNEDNI